MYGKREKTDITWYVHLTSLHSTRTIARNVSSSDACIGKRNSTLIQDNRNTLTGGVAETKELLIVSVREEDIFYVYIRVNHRIRYRVDIDKGHTLIF